MRWMTLLLPAAAGAFLVTASCSKNKGPEDVTPETQPSAAAPAADSAKATLAQAAPNCSAIVDPLTVPSA